MQSEEYRLMSMYRGFNELNQQYMLLEKDLREYCVKKILEENNPFYYCEHEDFLIKHVHQIKSNLHARIRPFKQTI